MSILTRYLLRSHLGPLLFAFAALTGLVLVNTVARSLADLAGKGLPARVVAEFFVLSLPANVALTLPMSVLVAVLYTFSGMAAENEITALKAGGVDLRRMVLPLLAVAALIAGGMLWFNDRVLPAANQRLGQLMVDVAQTSPLLVLREGAVNAVGGGGGAARYYLRAERIDAAESRMWGVTVHDLTRSETARTIFADSARIARSQQGPRTDLVLVLHDGHMREVQMSQPETFQQAAFRRQVLRMEGVSQQLQRTEQSSYRDDRAMSIGTMRGRIDTLQVQLREVRAIAGRAMPPSAGIPAGVQRGGRPLSYAEARAQDIGLEIRALEVEIQKKYSIAASTLVFVLIGVPLALRFPRGGVGMVIAVSLAIFSIYYVGLEAGGALADRGLVPPAVAMWLANGVFGSLGLLGLLRAGREQGSARDGGWGEWPRWPRWRGSAVGATRS